MPDFVPKLSDDVLPPLILGAERLTEALVEGVPVQDLVARLSGPFADEDTVCAALFDTAVLALLMNQRELGLSLQADLYSRRRLFRYGSHWPSDLRVLAIAAPGDLQMNMPIEFIIAHLDVRLDLLVLAPGEALPEVLPDHDVAFCAISDSDPQALARAARLLNAWPRPVLNHPARIAGGRIEALARDGYARMFAQSSTIHLPATKALSREETAAALGEDDVAQALLPGCIWPLLIRPLGSHAGAALARVQNAMELAAYLRDTPGARFHVSRFVDYRDADGLYRKQRVALIGGVAFLCHMGVSTSWMIHYLNAGMEQSEAKRADEAAAMASFRTGFAVRHAAAFAELHAALGLDYVVIDCAQGPDGRLLLFEVEMAAIVHLLDPEAVFPYKRPQMRQVFEAFGALLEAARQRPPPAQCGAGAGLAGGVTGLGSARVAGIGGFGPICVSFFASETSDAPGSARTIVADP